MGENIIFCYSGTGNCLDIAKNIAKELGDTDIVMMRSFPAVTDAVDYKRVGFVFPCYGGGFPGGLENSLKALRISEEAYKFAVVSYAGYPGTGLYKLHRLFGLDYWKGISHQCSCIWLFPHTLMMPPKTPKGAQKRSEKLAKRVANDVLAGKKLDGRPSKMILNVPESAAWPVLAKLKAKKLKSGDKCISCGQCVKLCPNGNIKMVDGKPQFGKNCIQCLSCLQYCPQSAISLGNITDKREHYHNPNISADDLMQKVIHID